MQRRDKQVALVTGASSGIGRATALALAEANYVTYATARQPATMNDLQARGLHTLPLDVTDETSMVAAVQTIEAAHGAIDVLVNNAGYSELGAIEEVSLERVRRQFETNVFGLIRLTQLVLPGMRRKGKGRIVNVSSMGGEFTVPFSGVYHASKYAVEAISDALRFEVQPFGVDVIVIQPGVARTSRAQATFETVRITANSPYAAPIARFRRFLETNAEQTDSAVLSPEAVARVIVDAVTSEHPETRYKVGAEAQQLTVTRRKLTDREWDALYRQLFSPDD
jgi:NAD(P)-dependent dehydrogenase (short-subunit alcohol dehydrogenase family)